MNWPTPSPDQHRIRELETDLHELVGQCFAQMPDRKQPERTQEALDLFIERVAKAGAGNHEFELALIRAVRETRKARKSGQEI